MFAAAASCLLVVFMNYSRMLLGQQADQAAQTVTLAIQLIRERNEELTERRTYMLKEQRVVLGQVARLLQSSMEGEIARARGGMSMQSARRMVLETVEKASGGTGLNIFVLDKNLNVLASTDKEFSGKNWLGLWGVAGQDSLAAAMERTRHDGSDTFVIWWPRSAEGNASKHLAHLVSFSPWEWYLGVSANYTDIDFRTSEHHSRILRGVLDFLSEVRLGPSGRLFVMSAQGNPLLTPQGDAKAVLLYNFPKLEEGAANKNTSIRRFQWDAREGKAVVTAAYVEELDWFVGLIQESGDLAAPWVTLGKRLLLAMGGVCLTGLAVAWVLAGRIAGPILELTRTMRRFNPMEGASPAMLARLRAMAGEAGGDAAQLAQALAGSLEAVNSGISGLKAASEQCNEAARELAQSKDDLERLNRDLEDRVAVRTAALEAVNDRLRGSEARYRNLFSHSPVAFLEVDFSALAAFVASLSHETRKELAHLSRDSDELFQDCARLVTLREANSAALEFFGAENRQELSYGTGRPVNHEVMSKVLESLDALGQGVAACTFETELLILGGQRRFCLVGLRPLPGGGSTLGRVLVSLLDVTGLKEGEQRLRAAHQEAQSASRAKSEFLANMSHEIRTPISAILGLAELSQHQNEPAKTAAHLRMIADSARSLLGIIGDVLDLSRVEAGKLILDAKIFDLAQAVDQTVSAFQDACARKNLEFSVQLLPDLPAMLVGDPVRLGQVLANLIGNAIKFTARGSIRLHVDYPWRQAHNRQEGLLSGATDVHLLFCVEDTGIGIDPELTESIFESFRQADSSYSKHYQGVGLGLAISRELVGLMGGEIWAQSVPGQGSLFCFTAGFQLPSSQCVAAQKVQAARPVRHRLSLLVAEDNPVNRHVFTEFLTSLGHQVLQAQDGLQALEQMAKHQFDLVFMDVQMPHMDGLEAVRRLRAGKCGEAAARTPVVALTAYAMSGDRERCVQAGMNGYLAKPITLNALEAAVSEYARPGQAQESGENSVESGPAAHMAGVGARHEEDEESAALHEQFLAFVRERARQAAAHARAGEFEQAARAGHDIKGTSMAFGKGEVNVLGAQLEQAARRGDAQDVERLCGDIYQALEL